MLPKMRFGFTVVAAALGILLGAADLAFAGANAKGCTTKLFDPDEGPMGVLCDKTTCADPSCVLVNLGAYQGGNLFVCGCPSDPASYPAAYLVGGVNNCTTFIWYNGSSFQLVCQQDYCSEDCEEFEEELQSGTAWSCKCPGGT